MRDARSEARAVIVTDAVLITGAGTGFGLSTALRLADRGFRVYASVPTLDQRAGVESAAKARGLELRVIQLDVTDSRSIRSAVDAIVEESGTLYGLVNNAGLGLRGFFEDLADDEIRRLFDVNVFGVFAVTRAVLPYMRAARRGRIVLMSSAGGRIASMSLSGYCAGKFALEGFGEALALEVAPFGLNVSLVAPGLVMTPHFTVHRGRSAAALDPESPYHPWFAEHERMVDEILATKRITPEHVANAVLRALTDRRPRLRYVVGWRARLLIALSRHLPGEIFGRIYARQLIRRVVRPAQVARAQSELRPRAGEARHGVLDDGKTKGIRR